MIPRKRRYLQNMSWSREYDMKLIEIIKPREYMWNDKSIDYKNMSLKRKTYTEIAGLLGGKISAQQVKERWVNIRTTFNSNVRRVQERQPSAEAADDVYVPSWYLWDACQFLNDGRTEKRYRERKELMEILESNIKQEVQEDGNDMDFDDNTADPDYMPDHNDEPPRTKKSRKSDYNLKSSKSEPCNYTSTFNGDSKNHKKTSNGCDKILGDLLKILQPLQTVQSGPSNSLSSVKSDFDYIGNHVTERLSKMRPFDAECAGEQIMDILVLYSEMNPNNPNNIS